MAAVLGSARTFKKKKIPTCANTHHFRAIREGGWPGAGEGEQLSVTVEPQELLHIEFSFANYTEGLSDIWRLPVTPPGRGAPPSALRLE